MMKTKNATPPSVEKTVQHVVMCWYVHHFAMQWTCSGLYTARWTVELLWYTCSGQEITSQRCNVKMYAK